MNLFILNTIAFYLTYWVVISNRKIKSLIYMYQIERGLSNSDILNVIKSDNHSKLIENMSGVNEKGFEGFQESLLKINEHVENEKRLDEDSEYRNREISKYRRGIKIIYFVRGLKIACVTFLTNLWIIAPAIVIMATGSKYMLLLSMLIVMTKYSVDREYELKISVAYFSGEEKLEMSSVRIVIFLMVLIEALSTQLYFATYFLLLNMIM